MAGPINLIHQYADQFKLIDRWFVFRAKYNNDLD